jgi:Tfp pilus assembly protein PilV
MGARAGFTTVEGMVAVALLSLAALGAAATMARSARILWMADRNQAAARATEQAVERLGAQIRAGGNRCNGVSSGVSTAAQTVVSWTPITAAGGLDLRFVTVYSGFRGLRSDTLWLFAACS